MRNRILSFIAAVVVALSIGYTSSTAEARGNCAGFYVGGIGVGFSDGRCWLPRNYRHGRDVVYYHGQSVQVHSAWHYTGQHWFYVEPPPRVVYAPAPVLAPPPVQVYYGAVVQPPRAVVYQQQVAPAYQPTAPAYQAAPQPVTKVEPGPPNFDLASMKEVALSLKSGAVFTLYVPQGYRVTRDLTFEGIEKKCPSHKAYLELAKPGAASKQGGPKQGETRTHVVCM